MTIKQQGGIFGRNPKFNNVDVNGNLTVDTNVLYVDAASNKVGINTSSPTQALELSGSSGARAAFLDSGSRRWSIGNITGGGTSFTITDESGSTDALVFASSTGNASFSGNLIVSSGNGIDFSATAGTGTSELFDDYEEGTWTPVPADAASGGNTGTTASNVGLYTKVGNTVYVQLGMLNINTTGLTAGNDFFIQGLPFTAGNTTLTSYATGACVPSGNISYTGEVVVGITDNTSAIRLIETASGSSLDYILVSELTSGASDIWASLVYRTA